MASAGLELQKAIYAALSDSAELSTLMGGARIYDDVPPGSAFPYVTIGESVVRDWSTGSEDGSEHIVTLHVWSLAAGRRQTHDIMEAVRGALHEAALEPAGHQLVNLRHEFSDARREADGETYHGIMRFRAVIEPA